jgi:TPR repeat protein
MRSFFAVFSTIVLSSTLFAQSKFQPAAPQPAPAPAKPPLVILYECEADQCGHEQHKHGVWIFEGNHGEALWPYGAVADLTVKSFDGSKIVIERVDRPESSSAKWADPTTRTFHATYSATLNPVSHSFDGSVSFDGDFNGAKGANAEWTGTLGDGEVCDRMMLCDVNDVAITRLGMNAFDANLRDAALLCFRAAESQNIDAEGMIGLMTFRGIGMKQDLKAGFALLNKTATAGSEVGQYALAEIYDKGVDGIPKNPQLATLWRAKAEKTAQDLATAQAAAARNPGIMNGRDATALLFLAIMGAAMGQGGAHDVSSYNSEIEHMNYERGQEFHRENVDGCNGGDTAACDRAGMSHPDPD